jgi:hypothetical protein
LQLEDFIILSGYNNDVKYIEKQVSWSYMKTDFLTAAVLPMALVKKTVAENSMLSLVLQVKICNYCERTPI